jgi:hypothetical protein
MASSADSQNSIEDLEERGEQQICLLIHQTSIAGRAIIKLCKIYFMTQF